MLHRSLLVEALRVSSGLRGESSRSGPIEAVLPPVTMSGVEYRMDPIPAVGEHTAAILAGIGRTPEQIAALHTEGTV